MYELSAQAERDIEDITLDGIIKFGEYQAHRYQASLYRTFALLADMPTIGRRSERGNRGELRFVHNAHVIYYRIEDDRIVIVALVYGPMIKDIWGED
jgi:toxin ParE1/3/4